MIFESTFNLYVKGYRDFNRVLVTAWQDVLHWRIQDRVRNKTIITHYDKSFVLFDILKACPGGK